MNGSPRATEGPLSDLRRRFVPPQLSPDGRLFVAADAEERQQLWPTDGGRPIDIRGLATEDEVAGWAADSQALFVSALRTGRTRDLARLDLATGRRQTITVFGPSDATGVRSVTVPFVSLDGRTYAYRYTQLLSDLYAGSGLR